LAVLIVPFQKWLCNPASVNMHLVISTKDLLFLSATMCCSGVYGAVYSCYIPSCFV
jgi:hypothetical protein